MLVLYVCVMLHFKQIPFPCILLITQHRFMNNQPENLGSVSAEPHEPHARGKVMSSQSRVERRAVERSCLLDRLSAEVVVLDNQRVSVLVAFFSGTPIVTKFQRVSALLFRH